MFDKNKNSIIPKVEAVVTHLGMAVMMLATVVSMAELADREGHRMAVTMQPAYAFNGAHSNAVDPSDQQLRRGGKEEIHHASATYGVVRRSHAVTGTL